MVHTSLPYYLYGGIQGGVTREEPLYTIIPVTVAWARRLGRVLPLAHPSEIRRKPILQRITAVTNPILVYIWQCAAIPQMDDMLGNLHDSSRFGGIAYRCENVGYTHEDY